MKLHTAASVVAIALAFSACKKDEPKPEAAAAATSASVDTTGGALGALKNFEGEIGIQVKTTTETSPIPPMTLQVKGSKVRLDLPAGMEGPGMGKNTHIVFSAPEKQLVAVLDDQKQVVRLELDKLGEQFKSMKPPGQPAEPKNAPATPPKLTKTGNTSLIAGYKCEDWEVVSTKGERAQVCVASEGTSFFEVPTVGLPADQEWAKELFDGKHLPLRFIAYDAAGTEETRMEVTRLERKPIADTAFAVPAEYKVVDLSELIRGLMGSMGGPAGLAGGLRPLAPGASAFPPGMQLPPGIQLPKDFKVPPGMHLPPGVKPPQTPEELMKMMQEHAKAMSTAVPPSSK